MKSKIEIATMCIGFMLLAYGIVRSQFEFLFLIFSALFLGYFFAVRTPFSLKQTIVIGLLFRLCFIASTPVLSDDYFRFIWDGRLLVSGNNPYSFLPNSLSEKQEETILKNELDDTVFDGLNSKQYYSVYPPINQLFFATASFLGNHQIQLEILFLRLLIIAFELGTFFLIFKLLKHYNQNPYKLQLYAFNPLVVVELAGNLHFEGVVLFFILLAVWLWTTNRKLLSPLAFSLAVGVKLIPLMLLPILFRQLKFIKTVFFGGFVLLLVFLYFVPFLNDQLLTNFGSSIDLYFRKFEFNASIFYLIRALGNAYTGYDIIQKAGPILSLVVLIIILVISLQKKITHTIFEKALVIVTVYFLFATTVHPWYITTLVGLSVFTKYKYALVWSYLVILSYSHYWGGGFQENYGLIAIEYLFLTLAIVLDYLRLNTSILNKNIFR